MLNTPIEAESPAPLVNIDYRTAGASDTPGGFEEQESDFDQDYRMSRFTIAAPPHHLSYNPQTPAPLAREVNGRKRGYGSDDNPKGWDIPRTMWALTGGAALKVASFAWSTGKAFTGFRAGGGAAYNYPPGFADQSWMAVEEKEQDPFDAAFHGLRDRTGTPIPGEFPDDGSGIDARYIENYMSDPSAHQRRRDDVDLRTPTMQGCTGSRLGITSTLKSRNADSWIIVPPQDTRENSPTRRHKKPISGGLGGSRASLAGTGSRPKLQPRSSIKATSASYASPRGLNGNFRSNHLEDATNTSHGPRHRHSRSRSSLASPRGENSNAGDVSPDVLLYSRKLRSKEKKIDNSMRRLNSQLEDMIREGKEALGTKVEVERCEGEEGEEDEGYAGSDGLR